MGDLTTDNCVQKKTLAQKIADDAAAIGIANPDGSPITVPLGANPPARAVYDTVDIKLVTDSAGSYPIHGWNIKWIIAGSLKKVAKSESYCSH